MSDRLRIWRQKLLDTGKRNKLLNFRETKRSTLKVTYPVINELYSAILSQDVLKFPINEDKEKRTLFEDDFEPAMNENFILSSKSGDELNKTLYQLRLRSKTALEELGVNILFMAFGFLEWTEVEYSNEIIKSPILLVPVELKKESILSPYTISLYEDDIVINPTLCYKLENDFGVKIEYDIEEEGFTVHQLFDYVSSTVCELNWMVNTDVQLSLFSFLKLNMYKDLEKNGSLIMNNDIIKALCGEPCEIESVPQEIVDAEHMDEIINPIDTFQVVDADSSQQQAILAAKRGISFVLQGPPGTGKSQTITNIVAEVLAEGKKVLFVSEKMAALEVVYRNLQCVGLEDFCLQLHSHKANKALVVKELADTLNKQKTHMNGDLISDLEDLKQKKDLLNKYDKVLHEIRQPLGKSVFQIHGEIAKLFHYPDIQFKFTNYSEITIKDINNFVDVLNSYTACLTKIGENYKANCYYGFCKTTVTFNFQNEFVIRLSQFTVLLNEITQIIEEATSNFSLKEYKRIDQLMELTSILALVVATPMCPPEWLLKDGLSDIINRIQKIRQNYIDIIDKENEILTIYEKEILEVDAARMLHRFKGDYSSMFRIFNSKYRKEKKYLKGYVKDTGYKIKYQESMKHLESIKLIQELIVKIQSDETPLKNWFGEYYNGRTTDWDYITSSVKWISDIKALYGVDNITNNFTEKVCCTEAQEIAESLRFRLENIQQSLSNEMDYIYPLYDATIYNIRTENIQSVSNKFKEAYKNIDYLPDWIDFINARKACNELGLIGLLDEVESRSIPVNQWVGIMLRRFYLQWIDNVYEKEKVLAEFRRERFENNITNFRIKDKNQFTIAQARIRQMLSAHRPDNTGFISRGSEIHTLLREADKRRKIMPVRKLFEKIPNLLHAIKPCLLMSPLSVSLFINPELYKFDIVIFDEASQVCSENAIGAIYRGKQLIVVGDREQLPPTNFFNASTSDCDYDIDDEDESDIGAYESILDECGSILNKLQLLWHYRSRHEHLITYSNAKIYRNLVTFPTPIDKVDDYGVEFIHVPNGIYERSTSRCNKIEAKRIAEIVFEHFDKYPERSLGIVTFSSAQQAAIDNEISKIRKAKIQYEPFFDELKDESFFIKNLENVQGDERDTIIFSVGYGKDQEGKLSMSFGPLNRDGGYRRLNVAITRAKFNVKLVSSILPTDIDINRTNSRGVHMLRGYMDFAIRGTEAIVGELVVPETLQFDSPFEMQVYNVLINNGFEVDTQVGCSGYRIDLAVRHPSLLGKYVIAIECDGATYHSARTARERDRLREDILKMRGWNIHRIWSTDWIRHRQAEVERMLVAVRDSVENYNSESSFNVLPNVKIVEEPLEQLEKTIETKDEVSCYSKYMTTNIYSIPRNNPRGELYYAADVITCIVNTESPIHKETIYRYMAPLYGREKITSYITNKIESIIKNYCVGKFIVKGDFCWSNSMKTPIFRIPADGCPLRNIKLIAPEEIAEGMKIIIGRAVGIEKISLFQEVSRALGFLRTGERIMSALNVAFDLLLKENIIDIKGETVSLK